MGEFVSLLPSNIGGVPGRLGGIPSRGCAQTNVVLNGCAEFLDYVANDLNPSGGSWVYNIPEFVSCDGFCSDCAGEIVPNGTISGYNTGLSSINCRSTAPHNWNVPAPADWQALSSCQFNEAWYEPVIAIDCDFGVVVISLCVRVGRGVGGPGATVIGPTFIWTGQFSLPLSSEDLFNETLELDRFLSTPSSDPPDCRPPNNCLGESGDPGSAFVRWQ